MTGIPLVDALLAVAAALGLREAVPMFLRALATRRANSTPAPTTNVTVHAKTHDSIPPLKRSDQLALMAGFARADSYTAEQLQAAEAEDRREVKGRLSALECKYADHSIAIALLNQRSEDVKKELDNQNIVISEVRDIVLAMAGKVGVDVEPYRKSARGAAR